MRPQDLSENQKATKQRTLIWWWGWNCLTNANVGTLFSITPKEAGVKKGVMHSYRMSTSLTSIPLTVLGYSVGMASRSWFTELATIWLRRLSFYLIRTLPWTTCSAKHSGYRRWRENIIAISNIRLAKNLSSRHSREHLNENITVTPTPIFVT